MSPEFLTIDEVLELHAELVDRYGGSHGLRDRGLLESSLAQSSATFGGDWLHPELFFRAAAFLFHVVEAHAFVDGNKRIGRQCALVFPALIGVEIVTGTDALYDLTMEVASGGGSRARAAGCFRRLPGTDVR